MAPTNIRHSGEMDEAKRSKLQIHLSGIIVNTGTERGPLVRVEPGDTPTHADSTKVATVHVIGAKYDSPDQRERLEHDIGTFAGDFLGVDPRLIRVNLVHEKEFADKSMLFRYSKRLSHEEATGRDMLFRQTRRLR